VECRLVDWVFLNSPQIAWWNWGDLEGNLKGKKLGCRSDPLFNDKARDGERKALPDDLVLGLDNWRYAEGDRRNEMVRLEVE
jgi:hypothetical protein